MLENDKATRATRPVHLLGLVLLALIAATLGVLLWNQFAGGLPAHSDSGYFAVLTNNGQAFYARVARSDRDYLLLDDVYYVKQVTNPETKAVSNVLVRRGKEIHAPTAMAVVKSSVAFVEPIGVDSEIANKIKEIESKPGD